MQVKTTSRDGVVTVHDAELIRENHKTVIVRLADGNIVKRHKVKHRPTAGDIAAEIARCVQGDNNEQQST